MKSWKVIVAAFALVAAALIACGCAGEESVAPSSSGLERATVVYVVDGDTLCVQTEGVEGPQRVRLIGVDCPESVASDEYLESTGKKNTAAGKAASAYTKALLPSGTTVWLERDVSDIDRYGRLLRYVWLEEPADVSSEAEAKTKMLNALLVEAGHAEPAAYEPDTAHKALFEALQ